MKVLQHIVRLSLALVSACHAASLHRAGSQVSLKAKSLRYAAPPIEPNVVLPLSFTQQLLVCNAYPGIFPMTMKHNGHGNQDDQRDIHFKECRRISGRMQSKDKLDFTFENSGIQGSFEIDQLPDTDAMLLLVVGKRDASSPLVAFQSFAFPSHSEGTNAQLAVIDAYKGSSSSPHLRMEDHINSKERKTISKRVEELNFNRIYAIEEGDYDASLTDHQLQEGDAEHEKTGAKTMFHLAKNQNYVILRTGDGQFHQSLVVYPEAPRSSARKLAVGLVATFFAVMSSHLF